MELGGIRAAERPLLPAQDSTSVWQQGLVGKVVGVALVSFVMCALDQLTMPWVAGVTISCISLTVLSELFLRRDSPIDWFSFQGVNWKELGKDLEVALIVQVVFGCVFTALGISPLQEIHETLLILKDLKEIACLVTLFGGCVTLIPIVEEILFRGFLMERLEDFTILFSRHVREISSATQKRIVNIAQAIIFGAAHISGATSTLAAVVIVSIVSWVGYVWGKDKEKSKSLMYGMFKHGSYNFMILSRVLVFRR